MKYGKLNYNEIINLYTLLFRNFAPNAMYLGLDSGPKVTQNVTFSYDFRYKCCNLDSTKDF